MNQRKLKIGYVGIGLMGWPMVRRLLTLGYTVRVFDIAAVQLEQAGAAGAGVATSAADAVAGVDLVITNLPTPEAVEAAVFGPDGAEIGRASCRERV